MRAAVCAAYGPPEVIQILEVPSPAAASGQVRVRVGAAAVNFPDVLLMANQYQLTVPVPFVPGSEFAGVVTEVGVDVPGVSVGDRVMGTTTVGAFAEEVVVPVSSVTLVPDGVSDASAAAFGVAHRTAYHVLRSVACVRPGERLVVLGAGGGVGNAAVQLGALLGASVTAVASSDEKLSVAAASAAPPSGTQASGTQASGTRASGTRASGTRASRTQASGAVAVINYRTAAGGLREALRTAFPDGVDVVVDPVGGDLAEPALRALRWGGRFVTVGYASGTVPRIPLNLVLLKGCKILGFQFRDFAAHAPDELARNEAALLSLLASGRALPHIGATFKLAEAAAALRHVADGKAIGKVVLAIT
jgi:NADPH:quinone reductase